MDFPVLLSEKEIQARVAELGRSISEHFAGNERPVLIVGILKGSFIFLADLLREIKIPVEVDFLEVSSYGEGTESTGDVKILKDIRADISGRDLILVEDIVDTGQTLAKVLELLKMRSPQSLAVCSLLHKPSRQKVEVPISYLGFTIEDHFVIGYGLDVGESFRQLRDIVIYQS